MHIGPRWWVDDVVEDRPLRRRELNQAIGGAVRRCPVTGAGRAPASGGRQLAEALARSLRVSNRRLVDGTGWRPSVPDASGSIFAIDAPVSVLLGGEHRPWTETAATAGQPGGVP